MANASTTTPQSIDLDVNQLSTDLHEAVEQVKEIQVLVTSFIDSIVVRKNDEVEKETEVIKSTIKQVHGIRVKLDKLGTKYAKIRLNNIHAVPLGNTGYVSLDPTEEQSGFYKDLLDCYTWLKNLDSDATHALDILKRIHACEGDAEIKHVTVETNLTDLIDIMKVEFPSLAFNTNHVASERCLEVKLGGICSVYLFFSGLTVGQCLVKSIHESFSCYPWQESNHFVFKKLSKVFVSVILKLCLEEPVVILRKFLTYISKYVNLFTVTCECCKKHLSLDSSAVQLLPPIWKEFDKDVFYHLSCK